MRAERWTRHQPKPVPAADVVVAPQKSPKCRTVGVGAGGNEYNSSDSGASAQWRQYGWDLPARG